jgi:hypothetical protein
MTGTAEQEWRELGFFHELDTRKRLRKLTGSRLGLLRLRDILLEYVADPRNVVKSEHEHYGPYGSLEVMTWPDAGIDDHAIHGSLADLTRLAKLVETKLSAATPGSLIYIREEYASASPFTLLLDVRGDAFDPSSLDPDISAGAT